MKLHPPIPDIPADKPYFNDLFEREKFGNSLFSLFKTVEEGMVVCVNAPWGEGKTTFARMWMADLENRGVHCIYFDAYEHDYSEDPFVSFCGEIVALSRAAFGADEAINALNEDFRSKAVRVGGKLLATGARIGVKALTLGIIKDSDIDALNTLRSDLADSSAVAASATVQKAIDEYGANKDSIGEFRTKLAALAKAVREKQGFPLVIVVDELDRCRPDYALALIERIKHLFSANDVSFLLLANVAQLQNYVKTVYGAEVDATNYLHKFFAISTELPSKRGDTHENDYSKYTYRLVAHYGIDSRRDLDGYLPRLFQYYGFSLREMERCFAALTLYYAQLPENRLSHDAVITFLAILRLRFPIVFSKLATGDISYDELVKVTNIDKIERTNYLRFHAEGLLNLLKFLLLPEKQFKALDVNDSLRRYGDWLFRYSTDRCKIIPFLCADLTRFNIQDD